MRIHLMVSRMTMEQADLLEYALGAEDAVGEVRVYDRTADAIISMPYIKTAKPTKAVPMLFLRSFLENMMSKIPTKASSGEKFFGLSI